MLLRIIYFAYDSVYNTPSPRQVYVHIKNYIHIKSHATLTLHGLNLIYSRRIYFTITLFPLEKILHSSDTIGRSIVAPPVLTENPDSSVIGTISPVWLFLHPSISTYEIDNKMVTYRLSASGVNPHIAILFYITNK